MPPPGVLVSVEGVDGAYPPDVGAIAQRQRQPVDVRFGDQDVDLAQRLGGRAISALDASLCTTWPWAKTR